MTAFFLAVLPLVFWAQVINNPIPSPLPPPPGPSVNNGPPITPQSPSPRPSASTEATARMTDADIGHVGVVLSNGLAVEMQHGTQELVEKADGLPSGLLDRTRDNTIDETHGAQLNTGLLKILPGLIFAAMAAAGALNVAGALTGKDVGALGSFHGVVMIAVGAFAAANNRWILGYAVDGVAMVLQAVATTPINEFVKPGVGIATFTAMIIGPILSIVYLLVSLILKLVLSMELAWVMVLSALAPIWILARFVPKLDGIGSYFASRWFGSLLSPLMALAALNMGMPILGHAGDQVDALDQLKRMAFLAIAYESPGFMVGAIAVKLPQISDMYYAGRLIGAGRYGPPRNPPASPTIAATASSSAATSIPRPTPVPIASHGMGSGSAASNKPLPPDGRPLTGRP